MRPPEGECADLSTLVEAHTACSLKLLSEVEKVQLMQKQLEKIQQERVALMSKCRQLSADMKVVNILYTSVI